MDELLKDELVKKGLEIFRKRAEGGDNFAGAFISTYDKQPDGMKEGLLKEYSGYLIAAAKIIEAHKEVKNPIQMKKLQEKVSRYKSDLDGIGHNDYAKMQALAKKIISDTD